MVGVLRRDVALFADSYLLPPPDSLAGLFDRGDAAVRDAVLVRLTPQQFYDREFREGLTTTYPRDRFATVGPAVRAEGGPYALYVAGLVLLFCGGSGGLSASTRPWPRACVGEPFRHRLWNWAVIAACFGPYTWAISAWRLSQPS